ncbi:MULTISPECIES: phage tail tube protein [unclassified Microbacterium]|uniref:phage tail tube protein n=1 Tax=unclassified Microbacterium TaxID=2609290 RepID=UPI003C2CB55D
MTNAVQLPAGTELGKSFEYGLDVNIGTHASPNWIPFRRLFNFNFTPTPTTQDATTYDDKGSTASLVTAWAWALAFASQVNRSASSGQYLPEVEAFRQRTLPASVGSLAEIEVRWYHKPATGTPNPADAGQGVATVAYTRQNTGPEGTVEVWNWTLTGVGSYVPIANPFSGWGEVTKPNVTSASPEGALAGQQVTISGTGFDGVTAADGVKFGTVNATGYVVLNSSTIVAIVPAGSAGSAPIKVKNSAGTSTDFPYTRGA